MPYQLSALVDGMIISEYFNRGTHYDAEPATLQKIGEYADAPDDIQGSTVPRTEISFTSLFSSVESLP